MTVSSYFLTPEELVEISGHKRADAQARYFCEEVGMRPFINAKGKVIVIRKVYEECLDRKANPAAYMRPARQQPELDPLATYVGATEWVTNNRASLVLSVPDILSRSFTFNVDSPVRFGGLYFKIRDGEIVYVGQSGDIYWRLVQHDWFDETAVIQVDARLPRLSLEAAYIAALLPPENVKAEQLNEVGDLLLEWLREVL